MSPLHKILSARRLPVKKLFFKAACTAAVAAALLPVPERTLAQSPPSPATLWWPQQSVQNATTFPTAEARLDQLRNALIDKALSGPTRIRTVAWVDETGKLRENVQINSDIKLRGIRMLSYLDRHTPEQARLPADAENLSKGLDAASCTTPSPGQRIKRHAALISHFTPIDGRRGYYFVPELAAEAQALLIKLFALDDAWVVTPAGPSGSAYEQALMGRDRDMPRASPYTIRIGLDAGEAVQLPPLDQAVKGLLRTLQLETQTLPALPVRLSLQVEERSSGRVLWRHEARIDYPETRVRMERSPLPIEMTGSLEMTLRDWQKTIRQALACEPLRFEATSVRADQFIIAAGTRVGMRTGDQLLLVDQSRFPNNMLEKGSLDKAALVEIQSVSPDQSVAKRVAGPAPEPIPSNMVAMPL